MTARKKNLEYKDVLWQAPKPLVEKVTQLALEDRRSRNAYITVILEKHVKQVEKTETV